jgi:hypothetical protein
MLVKALLVCGRDALQALDGLESVRSDGNEPFQVLIVALYGFIEFVGARVERLQIQTDFVAGPPAPTSPPLTPRPERHEHRHANQHNDQSGNGSGCPVPEQNHQNH